MKHYTKTKVIKLTDQQYNTLKKLESYNVIVCDFIREAINEKIQREHLEIKERVKKSNCPF